MPRLGTSQLGTSQLGSVQEDITGTEWKLQRDKDVFEADLFDVEVVDTANPFGNYAVAYIDDTEGDAFDNYPRGTRVDIYYNDGSSQKIRFSGYVVERREGTIGGADTLEVECYSFDQFLRRNTVSTDLSGQTIESALESIITDDTPVDWVASNVTVGDSQTLTQSYRGDKVENAIQNIAAKSSDEAFGVNRDIEFFFEPRDADPAPRDIDNTQWLNYDIPERGKGSVNQVTVFYDSGNKSVTVDDGGDKLDLQNSLGTNDPITFAEEVNRPNITDIDDARAVASQILGEREPTLTGTVTTFDLFDAEPGDVLNIRIVPRGIDNEFRIAEIEYSWRDASTTLTIVEKRGNQDDLLVSLSDTLKRTEMRTADRDATGNVITNTTVRSIVTPSGDADGTTFEDVVITNELRNQIRDGWAGNGNVTVSEIAVGNGTSQPTRTDTSLDNQLSTESVSESLTNSTTVEYTASTTETDIREIGLLDGSGNLLARGTVPDTTFSSPVSLTYTLSVSNDSSVARGVITDTGQTSVRDIIADNSPALPDSYAYGTDGTDPTTSDTSLGNQIVEESLDELLVQDADTDSEWSDISPSFGDSEPKQITGGELTSKQSLFTLEAEDRNSGDATILNDSKYSGGTARSLNDADHFLEWTFTNDYDIPDGEFELSIRRIGDGSGVPDLVWTIDGTQISTYAANSLGSLDWVQLSAQSSWSDPGAIEAGQHTIRVEVTNSGTDAFIIDLVAPNDDRQSYNFDNSTDSNDALSGPENFPNVEVELSEADTSRTLDEATATQTWNDTSNNQFIELSNDGGNTWITTNNSQTASATFASPETGVRTRVGISRFGSNTTTTPTDGDTAQAIDDHTLTANVDAIVPSDIGAADVQAIVSPGTIAGETIQEGGQLDSSNNLLTHTVFAAIDVETGQRVLSSENIKWSNPE